MTYLFFLFVFFSFKTFLWWLNHVSYVTGCDLFLGNNYFTVIITLKSSYINDNQY